MLKFVMPVTTYLEVDDEQKSLFLNIPSEHYLKLKEDFKIATHLKAIDDVNLHQANGVIINCESKVDGYIAATYLYKKYLADQYESKEAFEAALKQYKTSAADAYPDAVLDDDYFDDIYDALHVKWNTDFSYTTLPILEQNQYQQRDMSFNEGPFAIQPQHQEHDNRFWEALDLPIILLVNFGESSFLEKTLEKEGKFIILINYKEDHHYDFAMAPDKSSHPPWQHHLSFEFDYEMVDINAPEQPYLEYAFDMMVKQEGYELAEDVDVMELIKQLKDFRKEHFASLFDLQKMVKKAIRHTDGNQLSTQDLLYFLPTKKQTKELTTNLTAFQELDQLIGLDNVKNTLTRTIKKLQLAKKRQAAGYATDTFHLGAVFMGNPGTAKTTVARIFGKLLYETGVLSQHIFAEVSRQDLIGQYVGWTAPQVARIFQTNKGGTIFIDEAYSLFNKQDPYSEEACTAIIQHMENNPDTLVIFAGYTEEMKQFIQEANSGLQSRITNIIEFPDYTHQELLEIFHYQLTQADFKVDDETEANHTILHFLNKLDALSNKNTGNGRLMRKLFSSAVGYLAQRDSDQIDVLTTEDIQHACQELYESEQLLQGQSAQQPIGFFV